MSPVLTGRALLGRRGSTETSARSPVDGGRGGGRGRGATQEGPPARRTKTVTPRRNGVAQGGLR